MRRDLIKDHVILVLSVIVVYCFFKWGCDPTVENEYQYSIGSQSFRCTKLNPSALSAYLVNVDLVRALLPNVHLLSYYRGDSVFLRRMNDTCLIAEMWNGAGGNEYIDDTVYLYVGKSVSGRSLGYQTRNIRFDQRLYERWIAGDTVFDESEPH